MRVPVYACGHGREVYQVKRDDDSLATILLVSRLCADGARPLKASEFWSLIERTSGGPGIFLNLSKAELVHDHDLSEDLAGRVSELVARATALAFELDRLEQSGVKSLTAFDEHYPSQWLVRLGSKAPPLMHAAGAVELLDSPGLGVVGSRDVSQAGGDIARVVARTAARRGLPLVSGGARGVDQLAMDAAFETGGAVIGILADSLLRKLKRPEVRRAVHEGNTVMCSPYAPSAPFSAGNAMGRNKLIYAQATLTVVIASDNGAGGTWSGASEALKYGYGPVAVWRGPGEGPGNAPLQEQGARPMLKPEDLEALLDSPDRQGNHSDSPRAERTVDTTTQPPLFSGVG